MGIFEGVYEKMCKVMGELQPIAFFLSASIVISGIFVNNKDPLDNRICTLLAAGCFFFAYVYLMIFRLTNFDIFFLPGIISLIAAFYFIIKAVNELTFFASDLNILPPTGSFHCAYRCEYLWQYFEQYLGPYLVQCSPIFELTIYILITSFIVILIASIILFIVSIIFAIVSTIFDI